MAAPTIPATREAEASLAWLPPRAASGWPQDPVSTVWQGASAPWLRHIGVYSSHFGCKWSSQQQGDRARDSQLCRQDQPTGQPTAPAKCRAEAPEPRRGSGSERAMHSHLCCSGGRAREALQSTVAGAPGRLARSAPHHPPGCVPTAGVSTALGGVCVQPLLACGTYLWTGSWLHLPLKALGCGSAERESGTG